MEALAPDDPRLLPEEELRTYTDLKTSPLPGATSCGLNSQLPPAAYNPRVHSHASARGGSSNSSSKQLAQGPCKGSASLRLPSPAAAPNHSAASSNKRALTVEVWPVPSSTDAGAPTCKSGPNRGVVPGATPKGARTTTHTYSSRLGVGVSARGRGGGISGASARRLEPLLCKEKVIEDLTALYKAALEVEDEEEEAAWGVGAHALADAVSWVVIAAMGSCGRVACRAARLCAGV